jgi:putative MATE family efflux protein
MWTTIKEALSGEARDHTEGDLGRSVILLAIPMVAEMIMESIFAVADIFWVSRLGSDAAAAVGTTESLMVILYALAIGMSMAATATVARRIGEKDPDAAAKTAVQVIGLGLAAAAVIGVVGGIFAPDLLRMMGASDAVVAKGGGFARVMLGGNATVFLIFLINATFRGAGDAAIAMRTLWLANILNIVLGPCFIFGLGPFPELGATGAAVATNIGRGTGVLFQLYMLTRGSGRLSVKARHLRFDPKIAGNILRLSATGIGQMLIHTTSWMGLVRIVNGFGATAMAGYTYAFRVVMFAILPAWGLSNAAATLVGQNLGAKRPDRAEQAVWVAARYNLYFLGAFGVALFVAAGPIAGIFTSDPPVLAEATRCLRIVSLGFPFYALGLTFTSSFNGAGDTRTPTLLNFVCFWLWEIPIAWVLSRLMGLGPTGVYVAVAVGFSTLAVAAVLLFRTGRWKQQRV